MSAQWTGTGNRPGALSVPEQLFQQALRYHQSGQLDAAEALYEQILAQQRGHFDTLHFLGVCRQQRGDVAGALKHLRAALKIRPDAAQAHVSFGNALRDADRLAEAIASYTRATTLDPCLGIAHFNLGTALEQAGRDADALASYERACAHGAGAAAEVGRANCLLTLGRVDEAIVGYRTAVRLDPLFADAYANLGVALMQLRRFEEALVAIEQTLGLQPAHEGALRNRPLALAGLQRPEEALAAADGAQSAGRNEAEVCYLRARSLATLRRFDESIEALEQGVAADPAHWGTRFELAAALTSRFERYEEAGRHYEVLLAARPDDARAILNRGMLAFHTGDFAAARECFERALALEPQVPMGRFNLGVLDLLHGDFAAGWQGHEGRWNGATHFAFHRNFSQPIWLGQGDLSGSTLLVHAEQGLGDTLQFCRYLPMVAARARRVVFEVPQALAGLVRRSLPADIVVVSQGVQLPPFDAHCPLLSLPLAFGTLLDSIPSPLPYLVADPMRIGIWRERLGESGRPRVGVVCSGNPDHGNDHQRSIALAALAPLFAAAGAGPGVDFLLLQNDLRRVDRETLRDLEGVQYFGEAIEDFDDSAALANLCDLVISVDTSAAHLAGALGRPVWLLLPVVPDWRWLLDRTDSPWYSGMRLFRQPAVGAWGEVVASVANELPHQLAAARGALQACATSGAVREPGEGKTGFGAGRRMQLDFQCHFNQTGVGRHCENAFFALSRARPAGLGLEYVNATREASLQRLARNARAQSDVALYFWRFPEAMVRQIAGRRILWWFFESDRLPRKWIDDLAPYDQIWAPSPWAREVLLRHGIEVERVRVVESGVNRRIFHPGRRAHEGFVFLSVGKYEKRKSIDETVAAFAAEFPAARYPRVQLWLKADYPAMPDRVFELARRNAHDPRIRVISGSVPDGQMADLYRSADAFVFASKAEGFGLPCLEAIACGLPAIATNVSAQSVFLDRIPGLYAPVDCTIEPIVDEDYAHYYGAEYGGRDFGNWAIPDPDSLRAAMRDVYENRDSWQERAIEASEALRAAFDWDVIAGKARDALAELPETSRR